MRRFALSCAVAHCEGSNGLHLFRDRSSVSEAAFQFFWEQKSLLVLLGCPHCHKCDVEETEQTEEARESSDTLLLLEPLRILLRGKMFPPRAPLSRQVRPST